MSGRIFGRQLTSFQVIIGGLSRHHPDGHGAGGPGHRRLPELLRPGSDPGSDPGGGLTLLFAVVNSCGVEVAQCPAGRINVG